ncbi:hypothetical protein LF817_14955 [Halobacillus sp. A1]|uniref:hypothetical protein n=1 Tax=Halobacillus sp. A1 TaxID=2880262 RepID=UPI0020A63084|nr:hypothetical protein [Halobacillus sp. A1]MCP3032623.1 hypothetical protein [Halobacillus sp. A1]
MTQETDNKDNKREDSSLLHSTQPKEETPTKYPSSELILSAILREYDKEDERAKTLDTRVGIFISLSGALLLFISSYVKLSLLIDTQVNSVYGAVPYAFYLIFTISSLILLVASVIYFLRVVSIRNYERVGLEEFKQEENNKANQDVVAYSLIKIYCQNISFNSKVNDEKVKLYKKGIFSIALALILTVPLYIISINL